jgi:hypothetical protein
MRGRAVGLSDSHRWAFDSLSQWWFQASHRRNGLQVLAYGIIWALVGDGKSSRKT